MDRREQVKIVRRRLQAWGYRLRNVEGVLPFTFLVEGKVKVLVVDDQPDVVKRAKGCDVMAAVGVGKPVKVWWCRGEDPQPDGLLTFRDWATTPGKAIGVRKGGELTLPKKDDAMGEIKLGKATVINTWEAAKRLGVSQRTVRQWIADGKLKATVQKGTKTTWVISQKEIDRAAKEQVAAKVAAKKSK